MISPQTAIIVAMGGSIVCGMWYFVCFCCWGIWCILRFRNAKYLDKVFVGCLQVPGREQDLDFQAAVRSLSQAKLCTLLIKTTVGPSGEQTQESLRSHPPPLLRSRETSILLGWLLLQTIMVCPLPKRDTNSCCQRTNENTFMHSALLPFSGKTIRVHLFSVWILPCCTNHVKSDFPCEVIEDIRLHDSSHLWPPLAFIAHDFLGSYHIVKFTLDMSYLLSSTALLTSWEQYSILSILVCSWIHSE